MIYFIANDPDSLSSALKGSTRSGRRVGGGRTLDVILRKYHLKNFPNDPKRR